MNGKVRNILLALMIILIVYFEIHSCSENEITAPETERVENTVLGANDIYFIDAGEGWITGQKGTVAKTSDGGESWESSVIDSVDLNGIYFLDGNTGWIVGDESSLFRTDDGGGSWTREVPAGIPDGDILNEVHFFDLSHGYILGRSGLYKTGDGGENWQNNWYPVDENKGAWDFCMVDPEKMYLLGTRWGSADPEMLYSTGDGADSWTTIDGTNYSVLEGIMTIYFVNENTGWGAGSVIMKTEDGGTSWITQKESSTVRKITFVDENTGFAVGGDRIISTDDGGETWTGVLTDDPRITDLRSVYFLDENYGWIAGRGREEAIGGAVSRNSVLISTEDGGNTWQVRELHWKIE